MNDTNVTNNNTVVNLYMKKVELIYSELSYKVCGICFSVHNLLGRYRNEKQYADALEKEFIEQKIKIIREYKLPPSFEGENRIRNRVDFLIDSKIILEIKAKDIVTKEDYYQTKRYLVSLDKRLGLLINFRSKYLRPKRIVN